MNMNMGMYFETTVQTFFIKFRLGVISVDQFELIN